jgi:diguanylate cyclase (GGDEF)-like protein
MLSQTLLLILGGCLLGALQLIAGVAIGMWLRRSDSAAARRDRQEMIQAGLVAERLKGLVDQMATSAHAHRSQLDRASQLLQSDAGGSNEALSNLVVDVVGDILRANQNLQSQLEMAEGRLEEQAVEIEAHLSRSLTDPLTGLPNRREFNDRLEERMSAWNRRREEFSLLLLDVDHFKALNDEHGHLAGDQVLAAIGRALRAAVRREDAVARFGGEEFAILLPNTTLAQAACVAEKVREAVSRVVVEHDGREIAVTVSGGLAAIAADETADTLIENADIALYAAKESGRNRVCTHDDVESGLAGAPTARLAELIRSSDREKHSAGEVIASPPVDYGSYLEHESISAGLAKTCDELRRIVAARKRQ